MKPALLLSLNLSPLPTPGKVPRALDQVQRAIANGNQTLTASIPTPLWFLVWRMEAMRGQDRAALCLMHHLTINMPCTMQLFSFLKAFQYHLTASILLSPEVNNNILRQTGTCATVPPHQAYTLDIKTLAEEEQESDPLSTKPQIWSALRWCVSLAALQIKHLSRKVKVKSPSLVLTPFLSHGLGFSRHGLDFPGIKMSDCHFLPHL